MQVWQSIVEYISFLLIQFLYPVRKCFLWSNNIHNWWNSTLYSVAYLFNYKFRSRNTFSLFENPSIFIQFYSSNIDFPNVFSALIPFALFLGSFVCTIEFFCLGQLLCCISFVRNYFELTIWQLIIAKVSGLYF